jgi:hypothetical protein
VLSRTLLQNSPAVFFGFAMLLAGGVVLGHNPTTHMFCMAATPGAKQVLEHVLAGA